LATASHPQGRDLYPEAGQGDYTSNALRLFMEAIRQKPEAQVLDVGPVCAENIQFFAGRVKRLYICDMFLRLDRDRRRHLPSDRLWRHLVYPPRSFDGIVLWELADRVDNPEVAKLGEFCSVLLRPGGMVLVLVLGERVASTQVNSFVIGDGLRLHPRPQPHLDLPLHTRHTREMLTMLATLTCVKSFIYPLGLREFLFQVA
jgi:hypothetical protein